MTKLLPRTWPDVPGRGVRRGAERGIERSSRAYARGPSLMTRGWPSGQIEDHSPIVDDCDMSAIGLLGDSVFESHAEPNIAHVASTTTRAAARHASRTRSVT